MGKALRCSQLTTGAGGVVIDSLPSTRMAFVRDGEVPARLVDGDLERFSRDEVDAVFASQPRGFLLKPDFKRKEQQIAQISRVQGIDMKSRRRACMASFLGRSTYKRRYFVLDGMTLHYYRSNTTEKEVRI